MHAIGERTALLTWLGADDPQLRALAVTLARSCRAEGTIEALAARLRDGEDPSRAAALDSALIRRVPGAWELVCELADGDRSPLGDACRRRLAMIGDADAQAWLLERSASEPDPESLGALALTGRVAAVELALELLDDEPLARVAGELVGAVAGLAADDERYWLDDGAAASFGEAEDEALPAFEDDDLDADLDPSSTDALPLPNPASVRAWWSERRGQLSPQLRYRGGVPLGPETAASLLRELPTHRRHALAEELELRSAGRLWLDTRTWGREQRARIAGLELSGLDFQRGWPRARGFSWA